MNDPSKEVSQHMAQIGSLGGKASARAKAAAKEAAPVPSALDRAEEAAREAGALLEKLRKEVSRAYDNTRRSLEILAIRTAQELSISQNPDPAQFIFGLELKGLSMQFFLVNRLRRSEERPVNISTPETDRLARHLLDAATRFGADVLPTLRAGFDCALGAPERMRGPGWKGAFLPK